MGLISEEDLRPHLLRLGQEFGIHRHEGFPLGLVGLQETFLRPFQDKSQPVQVVQANCCGLGESPKRSWTNLRTTFQFQFARPMPAFSGSACTAAFSWACWSPSRAGGATRLFEAKGRGTSVAEGSDPRADGVGIPFQRLGYRRRSPALGQKPESMPPFPPPEVLALDTCVLAGHLHPVPPFKKFHYVPHTHTTALDFSYRIPQLL